MHSCLCISDSEFNSKLSTPAISYIIDLPLAIKKVIDVSTTGMSNVKCHPGQGRHGDRTPRPTIITIRDTLAKRFDRFLHVGCAAPNSTKKGNLAHCGRGRRYTLQIYKNAKSYQLTWSDGHLCLNNRSSTCFRKDAPKYLPNCALSFQVFARRLASNLSGCFASKTGTD